MSARINCLEETDKQYTYCLDAVYIWHELLDRLDTTLTDNQ